MKIKYYILDDKKNIVPVDDVMIWGKFFEKNELRTVAKTDVYGQHVSTVFLGLDHGINEDNPILWETMVFNNGSSGELEERCSGSWNDALEMHNRMVNKIKKEKWLL